MYNNKQAMKMKKSLGLKGPTKPGQMMEAASMMKKGLMCKHCKSTKHTSAKHMKTHKKGEEPRAVRFPDPTATSKMKHKAVKLVKPSQGHKPKGAHGRAAVKALGRTKTTGNFARIEKANGKGAAVAAYQNALRAHRNGKRKTKKS